MLKCLEGNWASGVSLPCLKGLGSVGLSKADRPQVELIVHKTREHTAFLHLHYSTYPAIRYKKGIRISSYQFFYIKIQLAHRGKKIIGLNWCIFQREFQIKQLDYNNNQISLPEEGDEHENTKKRSYEKNQM